MKRKLDLRRITAWALCLLLCAVSLPGASAAAAPPEKKYYTLEEVSACTLDLSYHIELDDQKQPMEGVEFRLYRVADIVDAVTFHRVDPFDKYPVTDTEWLKRAATLAGFVSRDKVIPTDFGSTGEDGKVFFEDLAKGLYLIVGDSKTVGGYIYTPTPFLLSLPYTEDGYSWDPAVETYAKYSRRPVYTPGPDPKPATVQYHVLKVWEDENDEAEERPQSVSVDLLRDGELYDTAVLSAENNWRCDWAELPADAVWQAVEREVEGYTVSVAQSGITFVITNTLDENLPDWKTPEGEDPDKKDPEDPDDPDWKDPNQEDPLDPDEGEELDENDTPLTNLPQTGQLWWPVPFLAMGGFVMILLGLIRRRRWSADDEE